MSDKIARLVKRNQNERNGGTYEVWNIGHDVGLYVDFNPCPVDTGVPETMAFIMDLRNWKVLSWNEEGVWYEDATGGKAIRELGYEPVEEDGQDGYYSQSRRYAMTPRQRLWRSTTPTDRLLARGVRVMAVRCLVMHSTCAKMQTLVVKENITTKEIMRRRA